MILLTALGFLTAKGQVNGEAQEHARNLYWRAPDVIAGTLPEMRTADYWVNRMDSPDKLILSLEAIQQMNQGYSDRMENWKKNLDSISARRISWQMLSRPGLMPKVPDIDDLSSSELLDLVKESLDKQTTLLDRGTYGNKLAVEYGKEELESFKREMAIAELPDVIKVSSGITVSKTLLRIIPSLREENIGLTNNGKTRWDLWNLDVLELGDKVQVVHRSASGGFLLVVTDHGIGWVRAQHIALAEEDEIDRMRSATDFLVVTGESVPFYTDEEASLVSGWMGMSTRIPFKAGNPRMIRVPTRNIDGSLEIQEAWLAEGADVSIGYLPYTQRNIISQSIKLLDLVYDWTGGWYGRNHVTMLSDLFGCFGFQLPRNGVLLSFFIEDPGSISPDMGREEQIQHILEQPSFTTIQISNSGHSQLLLGDHKNMPIVLDTHGYGFENEDGNAFEIRRSVIGTVEIPDYMLKQKMTFIELNK